MKYKIDLSQLFNVFLFDSHISVSNEPSCPFLSDFLACLHFSTNELIIKKFPNSAFHKFIAAEISLLLLYTDTTLTH